MTTKTPTKFQASTEDAQVIGQAMLPFVQILTAEEIQPILEKNGIETVAPNEWYPQQKFCDIYRDIVENEGNFSLNLVAIGKQTMAAVEFPPEINSLFDALSALDGMYKAIHQNIPDTEGWTVEQIDDEHIEVRFNSPYADSAAYGYVWTIARRFRPEERTFSVTQSKENNVTVFTVNLK